MHFSTSQNYPVAKLFGLLEKELKHSLSKYQVLLRNEPLEVVRHGKEMRLGDLNLKSGDSLFITELGITITVVNPQVSLWVTETYGLLKGHI